MTTPDPLEPRSRRRVDLFIAAALFLAACILMVRVGIRGADIFSNRATAYAVYAALGAFALVFGYWSRSTRRDGWFFRTIRVGAAFAAVALALLLTSRAISGELFHRPFEPVVQLRDKTTDAKLRWSVRVLQHARSAARLDTLIEVPSGWPLPDAVEFAIGATAEGQEMIVARLPGVDRVCLGPQRPEPRPDRLFHDGPVCRSPEELDASLTFVAPRRGRWAAPVVRGPTAEPWPQYRRNNEKLAVVRRTGPTASGWSQATFAGARATPSIAGDLVVIGSHGAGSLEAFYAVDGRPAWRVFLPNWVHQDAVFDGRVLFVGFGDKEKTPINGPAGIAALDVRTGAALWTAFDSLQSQMTSPVSRGPALVHVNAGGELRVRSSEDGTRVRELQLPGRMNMGSPTLRNDTLIATLDPNRTCAVRLEPFALLWCVDVSQAFFIGDSSPTIVGDTVFLSGIVAPTWKVVAANVDQLGVRDFARWVGSFIYTPWRVALEFQAVVALHLSDGRVLWRSREYFKTRAKIETHEAFGHISGAPAADSRVVAINLPLAEVLLVLDRQNLSTRWTVPSGGARGPILLFDDRAYVTTRSGALRAFDAITGKLVCERRLPGTYDRAGPIAAFGALYVASLEGRISAVPLTTFDSCDRG